MNILQSMRYARKSALGIKLAAMLACAGILPLALAQNPVASAAPSTAAKAPRIYLADAIIAVVNNEVITRQELVERMQQVEQRMKNQGIALPPPQEFQRQLLERMILDRAQLQLAKEYGIRVDDA